MGLSRMGDMADDCFDRMLREEAEIDTYKQMSIDELVRGIRKTVKHDVDVELPTHAVNLLWKHKTKRSLDDRDKMYLVKIYYEYVGRD